MSETGKIFHKIEEGDDNYKPARSIFEALGISHKGMITIEETKENVLSIVAYHTGENGKNLITHLELQFERKEEEGFLLPLFIAIGKALDTILQTKNSNKSFDLEKILQENNYKLLNLETKNAYTYTGKEEEGGYVYSGNNPHVSSILITFEKKVA